MFQAPIDDYGWLTEPPASAEEGVIRVGEEGEGMLPAGRAASRQHTPQDTASRPTSHPPAADPMPWLRILPQYHDHCFLVPSCLPACLQARLVPLVRLLNALQAALEAEVQRSAAALGQLAPGLRKAVMQAFAEKAFNDTLARALSRCGSAKARSFWGGQA